MQKHPQWKQCLEVCHTLTNAGYQAWLAGGCVRDGLLGVMPKDFDIATNARPETVEGLFKKTVAVGKAFGVIRVVHTEGLGDIEVVTFRHDGAYADGRRPTSVVFCTPEEDAQRRDFTVNALFLDPQTSEVHDFVKGMADLKIRLLRTVGKPQVRFAEDHLRILRAARFAAQLNFEIESKTYEAMRELHAHIATVSPERVREELTKLLLSQHALKGLSAAESCGLLYEVLPEMRALPLSKVENLDAYTLAKLILEGLRKDGKINSENAWAALLYFTQKPQEILTRLRFSNKQSENILQILQMQKNLGECKAWSRAQTLLFFNNPISVSALEIYFRVQQILKPQASINQQISNLMSQRQEFKGLPPALLTADDLMQLGMTPGKELGNILRKGFEAQLNLEFGSKPGAIDWVQKNLKSK